MIIGVIREHKRNGILSKNDTKKYHRVCKINVKVD